MRIGIVGLGVVGNACKFGFEKLGHTVKVHDIKLETKLEDVLETSICFICVPTPDKEDGSCDTGIVERVVAELDHKGYEGIIAIKSTVEPGTTQKLINLYQEDKGICFIPEFLRERCAVTDFVEMHHLLAVGTEDEDVFNIIVKAHGNFPHKVVQLGPTEAELLKYYSNCFNAMRIIFANEFFEVCEELGADYRSIKNAFIAKGGIKDIYLDVNENWRGYGGMCLPKDVKAMNALTRKLGLDLDFFEMLDYENSKFDKTVPDGMRL